MSSSPSTSCNKRVRDPMDDWRAEMMAERKRTKRPIFTAQRKKAVKDTVRQNEIALNVLPLELRKMIWTYVLGGRTLHVGCNSWNQDWMTAECSHERPPAQDENHWRVGKHVTSQAAQLKKETKEEQWAREERQMELARWYAHAECLAPWSKDCGRVHYDPTNEYHSGCFLGRCALLRCCRQVYCEASDILWTTNTFSFQEPQHFYSFVRQRTVHERKLLASIQLLITPRKHMSMEWDKAISKGIVKSLIGLKNLYLHVDLWDDFLELESRQASLDYGLFPQYLKPLAKTLKSFAGCPLQVLTVVVGNIGGFDPVTVDPKGHYVRTQWASILKGAIRNQLESKATASVPYLMRLEAALERSRTEVMRDPKLRRREPAVLVWTLAYLDQGEPKDGPS